MQTFSWGELGWRCKGEVYSKSFHRNNVCFSFLITMTEGAHVLTRTTGRSWKYRQASEVTDSKRIINGTDTGIWQQQVLKEWSLRVYPPPIHASAIQLKGTYNVVPYERQWMELNGRKCLYAPDSKTETKQRGRTSSRSYPIMWLTLRALRIGLIFRVKRTSTTDKERQRSLWFVARAWKSVCVERSHSSDSL